MKQTRNIDLRLTCKQEKPGPLQTQIGRVRTNWQSNGLVGNVHTPGLLFSFLA
jgi:hypothetical protein